MYIWNLIFYFQGLFSTPQTTTQPTLNFAAPASTAGAKTSQTTLSFGSTPGVTTSTAVTSTPGGISFGFPAKTTSTTGFSLAGKQYLKYVYSIY